jgi:hypothetical protein
MGCSYSDEQLKFKVTGRVFEQYNVMPLPWKCFIKIP